MQDYSPIIIITILLIMVIASLLTIVRQERKIKQLEKLTTIPQHPLVIPQTKDIIVLESKSSIDRGILVASYSETQVIDHVIKEMKDKLLNDASQYIEIKTYGTEGHLELTATMMVGNLKS